MARIVLLGSNGQLGSDIVKVFEGSGHDLLALTRDSFAIDRVSELANLGNIDYIINCIAYINVDGAESNYTTAQLINCGWLYELALFCNKHDITLIHISTDYVYNGNQDYLVSETAATLPRNIYGLTKLSGEQVLTAYHDKLVILRVASLYGVFGASGKGGNFVNTMLRLATSKDRFGVISNQYSHPTHSRDVALVIKYFMDHSVNDYGVYNCVGSQWCSWFDFASMILTVSGLDTHKLEQLDFNTYPFVAHRPQYTKLDTSKLDRYIKLKPYGEALLEYFELKKKHDIC